MSAPPRGHRVVDHTADEILEAWGPTRGVCLEEAVLGLVALFARVRDGAATRPHETTLAGDDDEGLLRGALDEVVYLADAVSAVPAAVRVVDRGAEGVVHLELVDVADAEPTGPSPKAVSRSELALRRDGARWSARALIDI